MMLRADRVVIDPAMLGFSRRWPVDPQVRRQELI
jgi:hypothetical protein